MQKLQGRPTDEPDANIFSSEWTGWDHRHIGDLRIELFASMHVVPTISVRVEHDGQIVTYSADSAGGSWLRDAARDADLFICEATWLGDADDHPEGVHLTARGAGEVAREAGARQLVLTHIYPSNDREQTREEAAEMYGEAVHLAEDGQVWRLGESPEEG
jgi:ribonuclease BN (tRNA processing enzyme)